VENPRIRTCFISAPFNAKVAVIKDVLNQNNVRVLGVEGAELGQSPPTSTIDLIDRADLVIGVLSHDRATQNVLFELGLAVGRHKQVLIFAPPKSDFVPLGLQQFLTVRANLHNRDAIAFALHQVLFAPERRNTSTAQELKQSGRTLGDEANRFLEDYTEIVRDNDEGRLEELVARAIRASSVDAVSESFRESGRADLAVWSDAFQSFIENPLLVEVKFRLLSRKEFKRAADQLAATVREAGSTWGLLLYAEGPQKADLGWVARPTVLVISIRELFEAMRTAAFADIVQDLRNRRVHGGAS
jgi:hypothetical protein